MEKTAEEIMTAKIGRNSKIIKEMMEEYASQFRTEGASTVPTDEQIKEKIKELGWDVDGTAEPNDLLKMGQWMREKMLKAKGAEDKEEPVSEYVRAEYYKKEVNWLRVDRDSAASSWQAEKGRADELQSKLEYQDNYNDMLVKQLEELKSEISVLHEMNNGYAKEREELKAERKETISVLWELCKDFGDNDWEEDLHMADIIDKHLSKRLYYEQTLQPNNTLSKEKVLDILEHYFGKGVKNSGRHHLCAEAICKELSLLLSNSREGKDGEGWIRLRNPEPEEQVLFLTDLGYVSRGFLSEQRIWTETFTGCLFYNVIGWQPLPSAPKTQKP